MRGGRDKSLGNDGTIGVGRRGWVEVVENFHLLWSFTWERGWAGKRGGLRMLVAIFGDREMCSMISNIGSPKRRFSAFFCRW